MPLKISYFKTGIKQTAPTIDVTVMQALEKIGSDQFKDQILQLRTSENKEVRQSLKKELAYFTFSGTFKKRAANALIKHSTLICIDLDDLDMVDPQNPEERDPSLVYEVKEDLKSDKYITAIFISPSGNGLKLLIQINPEAHLASFISLEKYFRTTYNLEIDPSGKDVSRACYASYDPEYHLNDAAEIYHVDTPADEFTIDLPSGDITPIKKSENLESMDAKTRKSYDRAVMVLEEIEQKQLNLATPYQQWVDIGMALASFGEPGRELFIRLSRFHDDYSESGRTQRSYYGADEKYNDLLKTTRFTTPAKFFKVAKDAGIQVRKVVEAEPGVPSDLNANMLTFDPPRGCTLTDQMKEETINYGFIEWKNRYWFASFTDKNKRVTYDEISNYIMIPLFLIKSKSDPKRLYQLKNVFGKTAVVDIDTARMSSPQQFTEITESQGNYLIELDRRKFHRLKTKWYFEMKDAQEIKTLGYQKDGFYAFCNGIYKDRKFTGIDAYGMIGHSSSDEEGQETSKYYFIPALSDIYKDEDSEYENEKKFVYIDRNTAIKFKPWADLFVTVHGDNGRLALMYYTASIFRDIIYDRFKFFPHLFGFGPPGTGKSTLGWSLSYLFGQERKPFNLNAGTAPGFYRTFAQFRNAIQWFDEYANSIDMKRIQDLKNAYDGAGHVKGDFSAGGNSNKTVSTPINSACYISGQELPTADNALFKRCVLLQFHRTNYTDQERINAGKLQEMQEGVLTHLTAAISDLREQVLERFHDFFDKTIKEFKKTLEERYGPIEERIIHNMVIQVAMFRTLEDTLPWPYTYEEIKEVAIKQIYEQNKLISKAAETSQFWDTVMYLFNSMQIQDGSDFAIKTVNSVTLRLDRNDTQKQEFDKPTPLLFISLSKIHVLYMKALREQGEKKGMNKESLIHYLTYSAGYVGAVNKVNYGNRNSSGYVFDYQSLEDMGVDLRKDLKGEDDLEVSHASAVPVPVAPAPVTPAGGEQKDMPF